MMQTNSPSCTLRVKSLTMTAGPEGVGYSLRSCHSSIIQRAIEVGGGGARRGPVLSLRPVLPLFEPFQESDDLAAHTLVFGDEAEACARPRARQGDGNRLAQGGPGAAR